MSRKSYLEAYVALVDEFLLVLAIILVILFVLWNQGVLSLRTLLIVAITAGAISVFLFKALTKVIPRTPAVGAESLIGKRGTAKTNVDGEGYVVVEGELWRARSASGREIKSGTRIRVVAVEGLTLLVEEAPT